MPEGPLNQVIQQALGRLNGGSSLTDAVLLERFAATHEEAAFEALVRRHGPMVMRVCQRMLGDIHLAEDAFQAVFIILARKAATLAAPHFADGSVAGWLHRVACNAATRARRGAIRRSSHEKRLEEAASPTAAPTDLSPSEWRPLLDEEVNRLPEKYRLPMVLCYLEGKTNEEAARQLQWPAGTVKTRLLHARKILRARLMRRGLAVPGLVTGTLVAGEATAAVPDKLLTVIVKGSVLLAAGRPAAPVLSSAAVALADATWRSMASARVRVALAILVLFTTLGVAGWALWRPALQPLPAPAGVGGRPGLLVLPAEPGKHVDAVAYLRGNRGLAVACNGSVTVWDLEKQAKQAVHRHPSGAAVALAISSDDRWLAVGGKNGQVVVWDLLTGHERATVKHGGAASVAALAFTPDSTRLIGACGSHLEIWKVPDLSLLNRAIGHTNGISGMAVTPDGLSFASYSTDGTLRRWSTATGAETARVSHNGAIVYFGRNNLAYTPAGQLLAWLDDPRNRGQGGFRVVAAQSLLVEVDWQQKHLRLDRPLLQLPLQNTVFTPLLVSPTSRQVATYDGKTVTVWDMKTGKPRQRLDITLAWVALAFSDDDRTLAIGGPGSVSVWRPGD